MTLCAVQSDAEPMREESAQGMDPTAVCGAAVGFSRSATRPVLSAVAAATDFVGLAMPQAMYATSFAVLSMRIGSSGWSGRSVRHAVRPSMSGIITSRINRSDKVSLHDSTASTPVRTAVTSYSSSRRVRSNDRRTARSSSAMRIVRLQERATRPGYEADMAVTRLRAYFLRGSRVPLERTRWQ